MRKVLFLMFLLFLMGLGAANVKAQVRIGGNTAPNAAAALDLNAADATNNGTKGLALPRVSLTNSTTALIGTPTIDGMLVYNTNTTMTGGSGVGIYYWVTNKWVKMINSDFTVPLSKIETTPADSGLVLRSNGTTVFWSRRGTMTDTISLRARTDKPITAWLMVLDTLVNITTVKGGDTGIPFNYAGLVWCSTNRDFATVYQGANGMLYIYNQHDAAGTWPTRMKCFAPN